MASTKGASRKKAAPPSAPSKRPPTLKKDPARTSSSVLQLAVVSLLAVAAAVYYASSGSAGLPGSVKAPPKQSSPPEDRFVARWQQRSSQGTWKEDSSTPAPEDAKAAIEQAFRDSYGSYARHGFGLDNYHPISKGGSNISKKGPVGYFIVDVLDSLLLLGMEKEYARAREWVKNELDFSKLDDKFHTFEITIRVLGGLLSAYELSGHDELYLEKAIDLGNRLMVAFQTPSGVPLSFINLAKSVAIPDMDNRGLSSVAEAATVQLEFKYLAELTGNRTYWDTVAKVMDVIRDQPSKDGVVPIFLNPANGVFVFSDIRLGSRGDSYYEYLLKQHLQTNATEPIYREMYDTAMTGIKNNLIRRSVEDNLLYTIELVPARDPQRGLFLRELPKQDHLVCFIGGSLMLGALTPQSTPSTISLELLSEDLVDDFFAGGSLIETCMDTYHRTLTGLAPEIVHFYANSLAGVSAGAVDENWRKPTPGKGPDWWINSRKRTFPDPPIDARNILRPETIESLFLAYRLTGDPQYRAWGWRMFESFRTHCRLPDDGAYASIRDVNEVPAVMEDNMETFWLSETLKYMWLLFSDSDVIPLDKYVFNTEAHILPVFTPRSEWLTSKP